MVVPLRKQTVDGTCFRPPEIEQSLVALEQLPIEEVARRAAINDADHPEFVPSECVLYFVRQSKANGDSAPYRDLFTALRKRVCRAVPTPSRRIRGTSKQAEIDLEVQIQDRVLFDFQKLLCCDRQEYDERLEYYEIRFNHAIATLRASARRAILRKESRKQAIAFEGDGSALG